MDRLYIRKWIIILATSLALSLLFILVCNKFTEARVSKKVEIYEEWFDHLYEAWREDPNFEKPILMVGSEQVALKELWIRGALQNIQHVEFNPDSDLTVGVIDDVALQDAFNELIIDSLYVCYAREQQIVIKEQEALDYQQEMSKIGMKSSEADIRAIAVLKDTYSKLFNDDAVRLSTRKKLEDWIDQEESKADPVQPVKHSEQIFNDALNACTVKKMDGAPKHLKLPKLLDNEGKT